MRLGASGRQFPNRDAAVEFYRQFGDRLASVPGVKVRGAVSVAAVHLVGRVGLDQRRRVHAAAWTGTAGRSARRHHGLLQDDGDSAREGAVLLRFRHHDERRSRSSSSTRSSPSGSGRTRIRSASTSGTIPKRQATIVGVVGTVKQYGLDVDGRIVVYRPSLGLLSWHVARTAADPGAVASAMVREIHALDPTIPVFDVQTMTDRMSDSMARQRFSTIMLGAFAVFALDPRGGRRLRRHVVSGVAGHARHRRPHGARRAAQQHPAAWSCGRAWS